MAQLTSTQSGNWTASTTWGGSTPADGDTFIISQGHKVTVDSDTRTTNGYGDISVRGCLHYATNGQMKINGRITVQGNGSTDYSKTNGVSVQDFTEGGSSSGALLSATGNSINLEFVGSNSDQHGIWIENVTYSSWKFVGDSYLTETTLSSDTSVADSYLPVASTTGFAAEDWVAVYNGANQDFRVKGDEGFWVHDVDSSNNRIYIKKFVGPKAIVSSTPTARTIVVDYSTIFRVNYKIIFGTGSNRNVKTITAIDTSTNTITVDSDITGTIGSGVEIYETGIDKLHLSGHIVRRNATKITAAAAAGTNTITIPDATGFNVGDKISVDVDNDVDTNWDYNTEYEIQSKSGNTLTLTTNLENDRKKGSLVINVERHIKIQTLDDDQRCFCYVEYYTDSSRAGTREIHLKDVEFRKMGGNSNNNFYRGQVFVAGYNSDYDEVNAASNSRVDFQSRIENCVAINSNARSNYTGLNTRHTQGLIVRNNASINTGDRGYWQWSSHYNTQFVNNYGTRNGYANFANDGMYDLNEWAYLYMTRSDDYGLMFHHNRDSNPVHNIFSINQENRPFYSYYQSPHSVFRRWHFDGFRTMPYNGVGSGSITFQDSYLGNKWYKQVPGVYTGYTDTFGVLSSSDYFVGSSGPDSRVKYDRLSGVVMETAYPCWNFESDVLMEHSGAGVRWKKGNTKNWYHIALGDEYYSMGTEVITVPANVTVTIKGRFRGQSSSGWSYPYIYARAVRDSYANGRYLTGYSGQTTYLTSNNSNVVNSSTTGFHDKVRFDDAVGAWQEKTLTISPQAHGYQLVCGYSLDGDNEEEIGEHTDLEISFNTPAVFKSKHDTTKPKLVSASKKRISGRI